MGSKIDPNHWKRPRPPLLRLCSFNWTSNTADWGGVWQFIGIADTDTPKELWTFRRVMSARIDGVTGDETKVWRGTYENGGIRFWRSDLIDPVYTVRSDRPIFDDLAAQYRAAERAVIRVAKAVDKEFKARMRELIKEKHDYAMSKLIEECPDIGVKMSLQHMERLYREKIRVAAMKKAFREEDKSSKRKGRNA